MAKLNVVTYENLALYDQLIKAYIDAGDSELEAIAKAAKELAETLNGDASTEGSVKAQLAALKTELEGKITDSSYDDTELAGKVQSNTDAITAINNETTGILAQAKAYADGKDTAIAAAKTAGDNAQADVDALEAKVGEVEEGKTVVEMIADAKTAATYDDTEVRGLISDNADAIEAHKTAIDGVVTTLVGEDTGKSVRKIANEELAAQLLSGNADADFETLQELAAWLEAHPEDAAAMNKEIADLKTLVGTLPEGATAADIVGYITEAVAAETTRATGVEGGLDTRLKAVEEAVGEGGSVDSQISDAIAELDADVTSAAVEEGKGVQVQVVEVDGKVTTVNVTGNYDNVYEAKGAATSAVSALENGAVKTNSEAITELQTLVGDGYQAITDEQINALFEE